MVLKLKLFFVVLLSIVSLSAGVDIYLNSTLLAPFQTSLQRYTIPFEGLVYCLDSSLQIRNVDKNTYENCSPYDASNVQVGHCANSPLYLIIHTTGVYGAIDYQIGETYYYVVYGSNGETSYCDNGLKFRFKFVDPSDLITSSSLIPEMFSSSIMPSLSSSIIMTTDMHPPVSSTQYTTTSIIRPTRPSTTKLERPTTTSSTIKPSDKPTTSTVKVVLPIDTNIPTIRPTSIGITSEGVTLRGPSILLTSILLILAVLLIPIMRTL